MVDKEIKKRSKRSTMDQHNDDASSRYESLELRLLEFIKKLDMLYSEIDEIKKQQVQLTTILKEKVQK